MQIKSPKELVLYQKAYALAMEIFRISKNWPAEEKFSLIDQIRRSSRSACANLREAWAKRRYEAHFVNKLSDSASGSESLQLGEMLKMVKQIRGLILLKIAPISPLQIIPVWSMSVGKSELCSDQ